MKVENTTNNRGESQRLALSLADSEFICFSVPVKQLNKSPARVVPVTGHVTGPKMKIDDEHPDNFDLSSRRFSFDL